ncbi:NAD-dependent epimerase/dehydratase family protein [Robbsia sp. KACC 23696]|uniref:NAD-dependent epimerase/dehydratase family protein n=1 Tax=Robbsia sp. KACC 23696 TaxID=3149231 RepID=UPI00325BC026
MQIFVTGAGGFIGGSIAAHLVKRGHQVTGLIRRAEQAKDLQALGITPVIGSLDDTAVLAAEARAADAVVNAADSDHQGAIDALLHALSGSGKAFLHTSGSSIVGDASGGLASDIVYDETSMPAPTPDKAARVAIDTKVQDAARQGVRAVVLCNTLIYGHGAVPGAKSVQLPRLIAQAEKSGIVRHVGPGLNRWSNVHIDDVAALYALVLENADLAPGGSFFFVESGEAAFRDMTAAIAQALHLGPAQDWPLDEAKAEWGYEMASYALGSNSRVRSRFTHRRLGWQPQRTSVVDWIRDEMRTQ